MENSQELEAMLHEIEKTIKKHIKGDIETKVKLEIQKKTNRKMISIQIVGVSDLKIHFR